MEKTMYFPWYLREKTVRKLPHNIQMISFSYRYKFYAYIRFIYI